MSMSRKDYEAIAATFKTERELWDSPHIADISARVALDDVAFSLAKKFYADNNRFDPHRFLLAAGVSGETALSMSKVI